MLTSILQLHSKYEQEAPQSAVHQLGAAHGNAIFLFALSSNLHTHCAFLYKDSFDDNNRAITSVHSKLSCFLH